MHLYLYSSVLCTQLSVPRNLPTEETFYSFLSPHSCWWCLSDGVWLKWTVSLKSRKNVLPPLSGSMWCGWSCDQATHNEQKVPANLQVGNLNYSRRQEYFIWGYAFWRVISDYSLLMFIENVLRFHLDFSCKRRRRQIFGNPLCSITLDLGCVPRFSTKCRSELLQDVHVQIWISL
jgi:hypothetical protein